jgi:rhamnogalacturonan endolyase
MEDPVYRWSVATQNNGYNVPPEPGFYFGPELLGSDAMFRGTRLSKQEK